MWNDKSISYEDILRLRKENLMVVPSLICTFSYCLLLNWYIILSCIFQWRIKFVLIVCLLSFDPRVQAYIWVSRRVSFKMVWFMVLNATFNNISVISWWSVLLVEGTGENDRPDTLYSLGGVRTHNVIGDSIWLHR